MAYLLKYFLLLISIFTLSSTALRADNGGQVTGLIQDASTLLPVSGALIQVLNGSTVVTSTNSNLLGLYTTPSVNSGTYTVVVSLSNYQTVTVQNVKIQNSQLVSLNFLLVRQGNISGMVTNSFTATAIQGATVQALQGSNVIATTTTASNGSYTLNNLNPGSYTVTATATNFQSSSQTATVLSNLTSTTNIALIPQTGNISGTITNSITGVSISGVAINILQGTTTIATTNTLSNGTYSITSLSPGIYTVRASATNFVTSNQTATVSSNQTTSVNAALVPQAGSLSGTIINASTGAALSGATVNLLQGTTIVASTTSSVTGTYTFNNVTPGSYTVSVSLTNFQIATQAATISANQTATVNLSLIFQPGTIAGTVTNSQTTSPLSGATVTIMQGANTLANTTTATNGSYSVSNLAPGIYTVKISATNFQTATPLATVVSNLTTTINAALVPQAGSLTGSISNASAGAPLASATINVLQGITVVAATTSASDGSYSFLNSLAPGSYTVSVSATNFQTATQAVTIASNQTSTAYLALTPQSGTIAGTVTNFQTNNPLSGATVIILQGSNTIANTTTVANGSYSVANLAPGSYTVRASATNFVTSNQTATVSSNQTTSVNAALVPQAGSLSGTIVDASTGAVLSGATVNLLQGTTIVASTTSSVTGTYTFNNVTPGSYTVSVSLTNFQIATQAATISANQTTTVNLSLIFQPGTIAGTVTNSQTTSPLSGATVTIMQGTNTLANTTTATNGSYSISNLAPGIYTVKISATNFQIATPLATVVSNLTTTINAALVPQSGSLNGTITNASTSAVLSNATINVLQGSTIVATATSDSNGTYTIGNIIPGSYTLSVSLSNFQTNTQSVTIVSNQTTTTNLALTPQTGKIAGIITNSQTLNPISGATVTVLQGTTVVTTTTTVTNGSYSVANLAPGNYSVIVSAVNFQSSNSQLVTVQSNQTSSFNIALTPQTGSIGGVVKDSLTNSPLIGATVSISQGSTVIATLNTTTNGSYNISAVNPGTYTLSVSLTNYQTNTQSVTISSNQTTTINVSLSPQPGNINGTITSASSSLPITNATVDILQGAVVITTTTTGITGLYNFNNLTPGSYTVRVSATNFQTTTQATTVQSNQTSTVNLALQSQPGAISGTITNASSTPINGATINVLQNSNLIASAITAANGTYSIQNLSPGTYTLTASATNFQTTTQIVTVIANQTTTANSALLSQPGTINGQITNTSTGSPISGAVVEALQGSTIIAFTLTDTNGQFTITGLAPGNYSVQASANSFQNNTQTTTVISNQSATTNISLTPQPGSVAGNVSNASNLPIANATVSVLLGNTIVTSSTTDNLGNYTISNLAPNSYILRISATNYQTVLQGFTVSSNQITTDNFILQPQPGSITGLITNASNPISGATIDVLQANIIIASTTTAGDGSYLITNLAPGVYTVRASATNFQIQLQSATVQSNQTTITSLSLVASPGNINGTVTNASSSNPILGAVVEVFLNNISVASTVTTLNGNFSFTGLAPGNYIVKASAANFQISTQGAVVQSNQTTTTNFALTSQPGNIIGQILDISTSNPIAGATVNVLINNVLITSTLTDSSGNFNINNLAPGNYIIVAFASNFQISTQGGSLQASQTIVANFSLQPQPGKISGQISDTNHNPITSANIDALINNVVVASTVTDASGNYTLSNLAPGSYVIRASANNYQTLTQGALVLANLTTTENFSLQPSSGSIVGQVSDATTGNPIAGGTVITLQGNAITAETLTDGNGNYSIAGLAPGSYTVQANTANYQTLALGAIVVSNQATTVNFSLQPSPGSITGQVISISTGLPVAGASIQGFHGNITLASTQTDSNGNYILANLAPGAYTVQASANNLQISMQGASVQSNLTTTLNFTLQDQPGSLSGQVLDNVTHQPVIGAEVDIFQGIIKVAFAITDSQGNYAINNLATGSYTVVVSAANYQARTVGATILANQITSLGFSIAPQPGSVGGQVIDNSTSNPLIGVNITALQGTNVIATTLTNISGNYLLSGLAPGNYTIRASLNNYQTKTQTTLVQSNQTSTTDFSLVPQPGTLIGHVLNGSDGTPLVGATVNLLQGSTILATAITDINGQYTLTGLAPGNYTLNIANISFQTSIQSITVQANQTITTNTSLSLQSGSISGQVIDPSSVAIAGAEVDILQSNVLIASVITDSNGNYTIAGLAPGSYNVRVGAANFQTTVIGAFVISNQITQATVILQLQPGSIAGTITDGSHPISGANVDILQANVVVASTTTTSIGSYLISNLAPGIYTIRAGATNFQTQLQSITVQSSQTAVSNVILLASPGSISGVIKDPASNPLAGAIVEILLNNTSIASTLTAADGSFSFTGLAPGNYTVKVSDANFQTSTQGALIQSNQSTAVNFTLSPDFGSVMGQLIDPLTGNPIVGATINISLNNILVATAVTDSNGSFNIQNLAPGSYIAIAVANNYQTSTQGLTIQAGSSASLAFNLQPQPGSIAGHITDATTQNPIIGASINALLNNVVVASTVTDMSGSYTLSNLAPGSYVVRVGANSYQILTQGAIVTAGQTTMESLALQPSPGSIVGEVSDATTGNPITGVTVLTLQGNNITTETLTDGNGNYSIAGLAPGSYTVQANTANYQTLALGAIVISSQPTTVNFALQPSPGSISGQVTSVVSGNPIVGASIQISQSNIQLGSIQTDSNGNYTITNLAPGNYTLQVTAPNLQSLTQGTSVQSNQSIILNFALQDQPGSLSGQVIDNATNQPITGLEVDVLQGNVKIAFAITDSQGNYTIANLATGSYTATTNAANYQNRSVGMLIQANQTTTLNFSLVSQPGTIIGQVIDASTSVPLAGATINALQGAVLAASSLTDNNGNYRLSGSAGGNYNLTASHPNYQTKTQGTIVQSDQTTTTNFSLISQPGNLSGQVLNISNAPVFGAQVEVLQGTTIISSAFTDSNGNYNLSNLAPGNYTLTISAPNFQTSVQSVFVQTGQTTTTYTSLSFQTGTISGQVTDTSSVAITGAQIDVLQSNILFATVITDSNGNYTISNLAPGVYTVRASAANFQTVILGTTVQANQTIQTNFILQSQPCNITGTVNDFATSLPLQGVEIDVLQSNIIIASATTASDGTYIVSGLPSGNYTLKATVANYQIQTSNTNVQSGLTATVNFALISSPGNINGSVLTISALPITGAIIELLSNNMSIASTITASDGTFIFNNLAPGNYVIQVSASGFQNASQGAIIQSNQTSIANFTLQSQPGNIIGTVLDSANNPIAGASVVTLLSNTIINSTLTDGNGNFMVANLAPANYIVQASAPNFQTISQGGPVQSNTMISLTFNLQSQPGQIIGQVTDTSTHSIPNANINLYSNNIFIISTLTDINGNYTISNLAPGSYTVQASAVNFQILNQGAIVIAGQQSIENFTLSSAVGSVQGQVLDAITQNPIPGGTVVSLQSNAFIAQTLTDTNGHYVISNLAPGSYILRASATNYQTFAQGAIVATNQIIIENFSLQPDPGSIQGQVTSSLTGNAIESANIVILQNNARIASTLTDSNGNYLINNLAPGIYAVNVTNPQFQNQSIGANILVNQITNLNFTLDELPSSITGHVKDSATNIAIAGANVSVYQGLTRITFTLTDSSGNYMITGLTPGSYSLSIVANNYQTQAIGANLQAGQTAIVDFNLQGQPGSLSGQVIDSATNLPIVGAEIDVMQRSVLLNFILTDSNGNYLITGLAPGNYTVQASAKNYQNQTLGASIQINQNTALNFALNPQPSSIVGQITDDATGLLIAGAQINVYQGSLQVASTLSDSSGHFILTGLAPGNYIIQVSAGNYQTQSIGVSVQANQIITLNFALEPQSGSINGQVIASTTNLPISGAQIDVLQGTLIVASTLSDSSGHFILTGLAPGEYQIRASAQNFQITVQEIHILTNEVTTIIFTLQSQPASISGKVFQASNNNPIAGAVIDVFAGSTLFASAVSDNTGFYTITGLAPGSYQVIANARGFQSSPQEAFVSANQITQINFFLQIPSTLLTGTITDQVTGKGIAGAQIEILENSTLIAFILTDIQGQYSISTLAPGIYTIVITAPSYQGQTQIIEIQTEEVLNFSLIFILPPPENIFGRVIYKEHGKWFKRIDIIKWLPSPGSNVVAYRILRDNQWVKTVSANDMLKYKFKSKYSKRLNNRKHTYKVIAVDAAGNESPPAKIVLKKKRVRQMESCSGR